MFILKESNWKSLNFSDYRPRFFIETLSEILHQQTPAFHQNRLMNIISSAEEVIELIDYYNENEKNSANLNNAMTELRYCIEKDTIALSISQFNSNLLLQNLKYENINTYQLKKLKLLCENILFHEKKYFKLLSDSLQVSITEVTDLKQKERVFSNIYLLTSLYISYLINKNYFPKYLYHRIDMFIYKNNYKGKDFNHHLPSVLSKLNTRINKYEVYFGIENIHQNITMPSLELFSDIRTYTDIDSFFKFEEGIVEKTFKIKEKLYIAIDIHSTDYLSATVKAKERLDQILDILNFEDNVSKDKIHDTCLIRTYIGRKYYYKSVKIDELINFTTSIPSYYYNNSIVGCFSKLDQYGVELLQRSLHYLRHSKETASLEQKLLNIWIALESIFEIENGSIISNILNYIPKIYAINSIDIRIRYVLELLIKYKINIPPEIIEQYSLTSKVFTNDIDINIFYNIFFDEKMILSIFNNIKHSEFLKFRLKNTYFELKDASSIKRRIDQSTEDVTRQIRRIYFIRNKIMHQANHENIKSQILTHSFEYLISCYSGIIEVLDNMSLNRKISLQETLLSYQLGAELIYSKLQPGNIELTYTSLNINPIIYVTSN